MSSSAAIFKVLNPVMEAILRSPFHALISDRIMILTFTGRRTGKEYSTPVSYLRENGSTTSFTHSVWWKNIGDGATVKLRIRGKDYEGYGVAISDDLSLMQESLFDLLKAVPSDAGFYKVSLNEDGEPLWSDLEQAVRNAVMVQVKLKQP